MILIMSDDHRHLFSLPVSIRRQMLAGEPLFCAGDAVTHMALVQEGCVHLLRRTVAGATVMLQMAQAGHVVAEASLYSASYHCGAEAACPTVVSLLPVTVFRQALRDSPALAESWSKHLARSVQTARMRAEIRTLRTVAERLDAWLGEGHVLPDKGRQQDVAAELGVSREALYRELARRRPR
ncbi:hypothetical protein AKL17_3p0077 (plasmid) [Frigidibacter mobilis]|uniref:Cyclic nucleotide-binding domain-containing protein n=2 Tax=Frigidibacter mobilis TaxID=1335048 RepID=A0A165SXU3_9RHOB|nr:hypothetical protein AKL17_3p0077 [Frigidibacter mobilis]